jgi:hypothetical protein
VQDLSSEHRRCLAWTCPGRRGARPPLLELTSEIRDLPVQTWLGVESLQQLVVEAVAVKHLVQFMLFVFLMNKLLTPHLKGAVGISALATCRSNKTYVGARRA